ncbi:MAG: hypothetical protein ACTSPN_08375 [Promethearchaeota archaeon]
MEVTIEFLKQLAINIYEKVHPLLGTEEGGWRRYLHEYRFGC